MIVLLYILGVVIFISLLNLSIALHECGHMIPARRFGVRVPQFSVGIGPKIWSKQIGETEFCLRAIPLMGWVKLIGMLPPEGKQRGGTFGAMIADARAAEAELIRPGDENRVFYKLPPWKKIIVMAGGPTVNIALAFIILTGIFALYGVATATTTVKSVADCVKVVKADEKATACTSADPVSPASKAGLKPGDQVVAFNGTAVKEYSDFQRRIRANGTQAAVITVKRDGKDVTLRTTTAINSLPGVDDPDKVVKAGFLGITPVQVRERKGPVYAVDQMGSYTWGTIKAVGSLPVKLYHVGLAVVGVEERSVDSPQSVVGVSRVAGELTSDRSIGVGDKTATLFFLIAGVNLFLGVFNFVPLLPLDGGHIAGASWESLRRRLARLRRRPDPDSFDVGRLLPMTYVVFGAFLVMTLLLVVADIVAPIQV